MRSVLPVSSSSDGVPLVVLTSTDEEYVALIVIVLPIPKVPSADDEVILVIVGPMPGIAKSVRKPVSKLVPLATNRSVTVLLPP